MKVINYRDIHHIYTNRKQDDTFSTWITLVFSKLNIDLL